MADESAMCVERLRPGAYLANGWYVQRADYGWGIFGEPYDPTAPPSFATRTLKLAAEWCARLPHLPRCACCRRTGGPRE